MYLIVKWCCVVPPSPLRFVVKGAFGKPYLEVKCWQYAYHSIALRLLFKLIFGLTTSSLVPKQTDAFQHWTLKKMDYSDFFCWSDEFFKRSPTETSPKIKACLYSLESKLPHCTHRYMLGLTWTYISWPWVLFQVMHGVVVALDIVFTSENIE